VHLNLHQLIARDAIADHQVSGACQHIEVAGELGQLESSIHQFELAGY
jgi:hypothetical protein